MLSQTTRWLPGVRMKAIYRSKMDAPNEQPITQADIERLNATIIKRTANIAAVSELRRCIWTLNGSISRLQKHLQAIGSEDDELKDALDILKELLPPRDQKATDWLSSEETKNTVATEKLVNILEKVGRL